MRTRKLESDGPEDPTGVSPLRRRLGLILLAVVVTALAAALALRLRGGREPARPSGTRPVHWRVIWTKQPATTATISWDTAEPGASHRLYYDTRPHKGRIKEYAAMAACGRNGPYAGAKDDEGRPFLHYHHAELTGLTPGTTYYLVMASDGEASGELCFRTAPATDEPVTLLYGADSRSDDDPSAPLKPRRDVIEMIAKLVAADPNILALAHGGDYVDDGTDPDQWSTWLGDWDRIARKTGRLLPIIPARGNHEGYGELYDQVFNAPGGEGRNHFTTALGPNVELVTLNTEIVRDGPQVEFLRAELASMARRRTRWRVAQYHQPAWAAVKRPTRLLDPFVRLFEEGGIDLACEADGHCIKRTVPIRNGALAPDGVVYIGEGGLGAVQRTPDASRWYLAAPGYTGTGHHVTRLTFRRDRLDYEVIRLDGAPGDAATLHPRNR